MRTARLLKRHFPHLKVFARARNRQHVFRLMDLNVDEIVRDTFFSSLELARYVLERSATTRRPRDEHLRRFREHDERVLANQYPVYDDETALLQTTQGSARRSATPVRSRHRRRRRRGRIGLMRAGGTDMRGFALADVDLSSFDRQFRARCRVQRPDRYRLLEALPRDAQRIARGSGVSYVAASFGADAISQSLDAFDRLLAFDEADGRLEVEAGARIGDVQRFALARGWYLPVAPGHPARRSAAASRPTCTARIPHATARSAPSSSASSSDGRAAKPSSPTADARRSVRGDVRRLRPDRHDHARDAAPGAAAGRARVAARAGRESRRAARVLREAANAPVLYGWHDGRPERFGRGVIRIGLASDAADATPPRIPSAARDLPRTSSRCRSRCGTALASRLRTRGSMRAGAAPASRRCRSRMRCFR